MTQAEFAARLKALGRGRRWFARECGVTESWVYRLGTDRPFPAWVGMLLDAWERVREIEQCRVGTATRAGDLDAVKK